MPGAAGTGPVPGMLPPMPMEMEEDHAPSVDVTLEEGQM